MHLEFFQWMCYFWHLQCPIYALLLHSKRDFKQFGFSLLLSEQDLLQLLFPAFQYRLWTAIYRIVLRPFLEGSLKAFILIILTEIKINLCKKKKFKQPILYPHSITMFPPKTTFLCSLWIEMNRKYFIFLSKSLFCLYRAREKDRSPVSASIRCQGDPNLESSMATRCRVALTQPKGTWQILTWSVFQNFKRFRLLCAGTTLWED